MIEATNPTTTLQSIRDYCDAVLTHATPGVPEPASRMVARRVREIVDDYEAANLKLVNVLIGALIAVRNLSDALRADQNLMQIRRTAHEALEQARKAGIE